MEPEMSQENALRQISGIGPEIARALQQVGITLETLTEASVADILEALQERNITVSEADVHGWRVEALRLLLGLEQPELAPAEPAEAPPASGNPSDVEALLARLIESRAFGEGPKNPVAATLAVGMLLGKGINADDPDFSAHAETAYRMAQEALREAEELGAAAPMGGKRVPPGVVEGDAVMNEQELFELFVRDIYEANETAHVLLDDRAHLLRRKKKDQDGELEPDLEQELIAAEVILGWSKTYQGPEIEADAGDEAAAEMPADADPGEDVEARLALRGYYPRARLVIDPLFRAVQEYQRSCQADVPDHEDGAFIVPVDDKESLLTLVAMFGIMRRENETAPDLSGQSPNAIAIACEFFRARDEGRDTPLYQAVRRELRRRGFRERTCERFLGRKAGRRFSNSLALAQAEYNRNEALFERVFDVLVAEFGQHEGLPSIDAEKWSHVTGTLVTRAISASDPLLPLRAREVLAGQIGGEDGDFPSGIDIDLPDLEAEAEVEILQDNLHAMQAIYFSAMLDDANVYQVRDALMNSFRFGLLPFGRGRAGDLLYKMMKETPNRLSEYDRRNLYARTLGLPGGDPHNISNRDFQTLWLRFVSAVSSFARQLSVDFLIKADIPLRVRQEQVKKAGRDLAANLSLYGYGVTYFAATELQTQINEMIDLLGDEEVKSAYGARDMWGVVEQVSALELGGARDTIRYRTMASAGAIIIRWLANHARELADVGLGSILDVNELQRPRVRPLGTRATVNPFDSDLVNACERWLAVTGTPDQQVESYAIPSEAPVQTSQPIRIPSIARDMLEAAGIGGFGNGSL